MRATNPTTHTNTRSTMLDMRSSQEENSSVCGRHSFAWWRRQQKRNSGVDLRRVRTKKRTVDKWEEENGGLKDRGIILKDESAYNFSNESKLKKSIKINRTESQQKLVSDVYLIFVKTFSAHVKENLLVCGCKRWNWKKEKEWTTGSQTSEINEFSWNFRKSF